MAQQAGPPGPQPMTPDMLAQLQGQWGAAAGQPQPMGGPPPGYTAMPSAGPWQAGAPTMGPPPGGFMPDAGFQGGSWQKGALGAGPTEQTMLRQQAALGKLGAMPQQGKQAAKRKAQQR